ncbi:CD48 antigen-like [Ovis canadensis]|uniref:CD48 antigen-like n=1 Tax=Ovis canadensis TaxID=37174 RepID=UPI00375348F7
MVLGYSKYATPGDNVSLQISNLPKNRRSLTWFYTTDQKIVEWESGEPTKYFDTKFKDRATLDSQSGTLHIRKVQKEDSSTYLLRVLKDNGHEEEYKISLMVLGYSKYATPGDNVSLQISNLPMKNRSLAWFYTTDQKIVERESGEPTKYFDTKFKDRATLDSQSGTLHIRKVQKEDSSTYLLRVLKDNGHEEEYKISLMVLDPVPKPEINVNMTQKMNTCNLTLSCGIQGHSVTYTWYWESGSFPKQLQSSVLEDVHTPESYSKSYTCQVSNPISRQNNTIHFTSPCVQASSSGVAWTATWLVIMVTTLVNLLWT